MPRMPTTSMNQRVEFFTWVGDVLAVFILSPYPQPHLQSAMNDIQRCYVFKPPLIGATPGISHSSHIASTIFCTYWMSSSVMCANRPCLVRNSRTGMRPFLLASYV